MKPALAALIALALTAHAQPLTQDMDIFARRRAAFIDRMDSNAVAIFPSRPETQRNLDVEYEYRQESNLYYLTGFEEPECICILNPSARQKYILFVRRRNPQAETYEGSRAGIEGAMMRFRADTAYVVDDFDSKIWSVVRGDRPLYYTFGINP